eukprot:TRINITY_DN3935_c1_g3_i1.p1 TRINITY_DN3935_c1_g3~~TRINITY_DN3935_c1_g3_i1.p1  ORF type:complete len:626 (+),score=163.74 TRINITY_DN3935_c1_g3_i1:102-1979(+)
MTHVSIPSAIVVYGHEPEHVVYKIICRSGRSHWRSDHRYREFHDFDQNLRKATCTSRRCGLSKCDSLPRRYITSWGNHHPKQIKERRQQLEAYLRSLRGPGVELCTRHDSLVEEFLGTHTRGILDFSTDDTQAYSLRGHERSHWLTEGPVKLRTFDELQVQFWDTCLVTFRPTSKGLELEMLLCSPQETRVRKLRFDVEVFRRLICQLFSATSFPKNEEARELHRKLEELGQKDWGFDPDIFERRRRSPKSELRKKHKMNKLNRSPLAPLHADFAPPTRELLAVVWKQGGRETPTGVPATPPGTARGLADADAVLAALRNALAGPDGLAVRAALATERFTDWQQVEGVPMPPTPAAVIDFGRELVGYLAGDRPYSPLRSGGASFDPKDLEARLDTFKSRCDGSDTPPSPAESDSAYGSPSPRSPGVLLTTINSQESFLAITPATPPRGGSPALELLRGRDSSGHLNAHCFCCGRSDAGSSVGLSFIGSMLPEDNPAATVPQGHGMHTVSPEGTLSSDPPAGPAAAAAAEQAGAAAAAGAAHSDPTAEPSESLTCCCASRLPLSRSDLFLSLPTRSKSDYLEPSMVEIRKKMKKDREKRKEAASAAADAAPAAAAGAGGVPRAGRR